MRTEKIYIERIKRFKELLRKKRFIKVANLDASFIYDSKEPIPFEKIDKMNFNPIKLNEKWGDLWGCGWFKFKGEIPENSKNKEIGVLIDVQGEGCVYKDGKPFVGITNKIHWDLKAGKYFIPITKNAKSNEKIDLLIETGANGLFGASQTDYTLKQAEVVEVKKKNIDLFYDIEVLFNLAESLEKNNVRRNKILFGLNEVCNSWNYSNGIDKCLEITKKLLSKKANASSLDVYSIGHAHLDLAWLWPIRETRRKGGRTFATALKMLEEFPEYKFGASQPQLYQWIKTDYPEIYKDVKKFIKKGRWECQGAMWCEPDMNIPSGESLVRQCLYGKKFYKEEFNKEIKNLWLPDVFGYSAALPQILIKSDVDVFMTQKISWNETNVFPHHTFYWAGIDGTEILTHFLPTNEYNLANTPKQLIDSEKRYAQNDVSDEFLNLYGIGDGGGGPGRAHIEMGKRQQNLEGVPKFKFSFAEDFFNKIRKIPKEILPKWAGELYLELHRGTYTTQALMKKYNRLLENKLHNVEFLSVLNQSKVSEKDLLEIEDSWKDVLLNQFHDILPGSSINWVYKDAHELSEKNIDKLEKLKFNFLENLNGKVSKENNKFIVYNSQSWERKEILKIPYESGSYLVEDSAKNIKNCFSKNNTLEIEVKIPAYGYSSYKIMKTNDKNELEDKISAKKNLLENNLIRVQFSKDGTISSIFDKEVNREILESDANCLEMWEDEPNNWGAWDINHFYRETTPEKAKLINSEIITQTNLSAELKQEFEIGNSTIEQTITITKDSKLITFKNKVDWREEHKMLRVSAKPEIHTENASFEIQYGTIKRPTHSNTSWDLAKFETAGQKFADLSQPDYGFAILNDSKYGYFIRENIVDLNLLRSPKDTDKKADLHGHIFTYAYLPHKKSLIESDVLEKAHNLNSPLISYSVENLPKEREFSLAKIIGKNVKLENIKIAENRKDVILRLYETSGTNSDVELELNIDFKKAFNTNLIERNLEECKTESNKIKLSFKPFEIKTLRLK